MSWIRLEGPVYWTLFVATFLAIAVWESWYPRRKLSSPAERRWARHGLMLVLAVVLQTLLLRVSPVVVAAAVAGRPAGVLNQPWMPTAVRYVAAILALDLVRYLTHRMFHRVGVLWRVHEVHHSDPEYDVSTAGRFHPIEVVSAQGIYLGVIALLAPPPLAALIAELLTGAINLFAHANASLPARVEKLLRWVIITPDMHRIHHSEEMGEQSRNFGQTFSWWDRLFGTYLAEPRAGQTEMITGVKGLQTEASLGFRLMLGSPFQRRSRTETAATR